MITPDKLTTDQDLRGLIRRAREQLRLLQREVAGQAGVSVRWYKHIESAGGTVVSVAAMLDVCQALAIQPRHLRELGGGQWEWLADELEQRNQMAGDSPFADPLEAHLWQAPAEEGLRNALIAYARTLRSTIRPVRAEPFADAFGETRRTRS